MRFCRAARNFSFQVSFCGEKSVAEIHVAILVDIWVISWAKGERLLTMGRIGEIDDDTLIVV
jgi:hypothetical protein